MISDAPEPFVRRVDDVYLPTRMANGFWGVRDNLHARVVIGLFAHEIETAHRAPGFLPARLTVDLFRMPDLSPVSVTTRLVREGGRIRLVEATLASAGVPAARAVCQLLRQAEQPAARPWSRPDWSVPGPEDTPDPETPFTSKWWMRPIPPAIGAGRRTWLREVRPLIEGVGYTPFTRLATGVDYTSPSANAAASGLDFINSDVTLYLHREPAGEWIGYEATDHLSSEGVAIGQCRLYDAAGPVGFSACTALAQKRPA